MDLYVPGCGCRACLDALGMQRQIYLAAKRESLCLSRDIASALKRLTDSIADEARGAVLARAIAAQWGR